MGRGCPCLLYSVLRTPPPHVCPTQGGTLLMDLPPASAQDLSEIASGTSLMPSGVCAYLWDVSFLA